MLYVHWLNLLLTPQKTFTTFTAHTHTHGQEANSLLYMNGEKKKQRKTKISPINFAQNKYACERKKRKSSIEHCRQHTQIATINTRNANRGGIKKQNKKKNKKHTQKPDK